MAQIFQIPADFGGHLGFMQMRSIKCTNHVCPDLKSFSMLRSMFVPNFMLLPQFAVFCVLTAPLGGLKAVYRLTEFDKAHNFFGKGIPEIEEIQIYMPSALLYGVNKAWRS